MEERKYMLRINGAETEEQNIIMGDVVGMKKLIGVVIGFTSKENKQYKVAVSNGDIEDWINPVKVKDMHFDIYTVGDIVSAIGEINKTEFVYVEEEQEQEHGN